MSDAAIDAFGHTHDLSCDDESYIEDARAYRAAVDAAKVELIQKDHRILGSILLARIFGVRERISRDFPGINR